MFDDKKIRLTWFPSDLKVQHDKALIRQTDGWSCIHKLTVT